MKKIAVIFGTRPEAIKLAPLVLELKRCRGLACRVCVTGQHREMLAQALAIFGMVPDVDLKLMRPGQRLADLTSRMIAALDKFIVKEAPDLVLVQGDTTTTLCAALAAFYNKVPVGHVEAGLRTWELSSPWPEEANRTMVSRISTLHFAPTEANRRNLLRENIPAEIIHVTGNTGVDSLLLILKRLAASEPEIPGLSSDTLRAWKGRKVVLITAHRQESFGRKLESICQAIRLLARRFPEARFVYPVHLNPNVRKPVLALLAKDPNIHLLPPLSYLPFVALLRRCDILLTDSGGLQEEAPTLHKPILVMRDHTERMEAVRAGAARMVGTSRARIVREASELLTSRKAYEAMAHSRNPFGDGLAAERIVRVCLDHLGVSARRLPPGNRT
jgi:UDP-N-acetylglucosamine 2-epimerase (non-hydrolysing)